MDKILNLMKCAICHEIIESPVILPCSYNICKKHVSNQTNNVIQCEKCGVEHKIPTNGFLANNVLKEIIETEIANLDFGSVHKEAKKSCVSFEDALKQLDILLKDPNFYTRQRISELKNSVQLKGEELKLIIDQEVTKQIDRLEEYERQSNEYISSNEFKEESKKLKNELKISQSNLDSWLESLNKIKFDEDKWKSIIEGSNQVLKCITEEMDKFKNKLLLNKFDENQAHVNRFKSIKIDSVFEHVPVNKPFNRFFLVSRIIKESLARKLEELLKKKDLNCRKWSLLYQGSRDGFEASNFHSRCDNKPNTLTIVKSTNGNIFGGFTSAQWKSTALFSCEYDEIAFIFSLVNQENRPLIFEHSTSDKNSVGFYKQLGPIFGSGRDLIIFDSSNIYANSFSNLGSTYTHPDYPFGSEKSKTILAGSHKFKVEEIEVFQMQQ